MSSQRLLIRNGFVVSMDPDVGDIPHGEVLVEDGKIVDVGRDLGVSDAEQVDATGMIVMPGFVDTHRHTWQTPVRGVLPSCTLDHYFAVMLGQVGGFYRPEDVLHRRLGRVARSAERRRYDAARLVAHQQHARPLGRRDPGAEGGRHPRRLRERDADRGRVVVVQRAQSPRRHPPDPRHLLLVRRRPDHARDGGAPARQLTSDVAKHDWALARELGILISVHVGMRLHTLHYQPVKDMHDLELMGPGHLLHPHDRPDGRGARLDRGDQRKGVGRAVRRDADGSRAASDRQAARPRRPPLAQHRRRLERPRRDVHADADGARLRPHPRVHRHARRRLRADAHAHGRARVRDDRRRRSIMLDDKVGSLTPGKQADIVLLKTDAINTAPVLDPNGTIVTFADTSNVDSVFVAGNAVKRDGKLVDVDVKSVIRKLEESRNHILSQGGLLPDWCAEPAAAV